MKEQPIQPYIKIADTFVQLTSPFLENKNPELADIAFSLAKERLAEKYDPIFEEPLVTMEYKYRPYKDDIENKIRMIQRATDIWALDLMAINISPEMARTSAKRKIDDFNIKRVGGEVFLVQPESAVANAGFLKAIQQRYDIKGYEDLMLLLSTKISRMIPDFIEPYNLIAEELKNLPLPVESTYEMEDMLEDSGRKIAKYLRLQFRPSIRPEFKSQRWFLDPLNIDMGF